MAAKQVKKYIDLFGKNVLVIKFDDFKKDVHREYKKICLFLNIPSNEMTR